MSSRRKIGRYVLLDGGPARWLAFDPELGRKLDVDVGIDASQRERARALAKLVHPNVVRIHDVGAHESGMYVAFDHVEGETLRQWCERERPGWRSVLAAFTQAGGGLAAAHREGLVHGAVSLDTMARDEDERVRVTAFLRTGTPAAMSAEDDVVAFASSLHEALWGTLAPPLDDRGVPRPVRRVLLEALQPGARPTMARLVARLRKLRPRSRRWAWSFAATSVVLVGFAAGANEPAEDTASTSYCGTFDARLEDVWNQTVRDRLAAAVSDLGPDFARATWQRAEVAIDAEVDALSSAQGQECTRQDEGGDIEEAVTLCLHRRFESLRSFVGALEQPTTKMIASLDDSIVQLGRAPHCDVVRGEEPRLPGVALSVTLALEGQLSQSKMLRRMGKAAESVPIGRDALERAVELGSRYYIAQAEFGIGEAQWDLDDDQASASFHRAFAAALASENDHIAAHSAVNLATLLSEAGRGHEARRWAEHAAAVHERTGDAQAHLRLTALRGQIEFFEGKYREADLYFTEATALINDETEPSLRAMIDQLSGITMQELGRPHDALARIEAAVEHAESDFGPEHPILVAVLISLADMHHYVGKVTEAAEIAERAVRLSDHAFGRLHYGSISARMEQMSIVNSAGKFEDAIAIADDVLESAREALGETDIRYPGVLDAVAQVFFAGGRKVEAIGLLRDAVRLHAPVAGELHPQTLIYLANLAYAEHFSGRSSEAEQTYREVLERREQLLGRDHPRLLSTLLGLGATVRQQGRTAEAVPMLERALDMADASEVRGQRRGAVAFELARALENTDRARAIELAKSALRDYEGAQKAGWGLDSEMDDVRSWLASV